MAQDSFRIKHLSSSIAPSDTLPRLLTTQIMDLNESLNSPSQWICRDQPWAGEQNWL